MKPDGIADDTYDFVYISNGMHVWIDDKLDSTGPFDCSMDIINAMLDFGLVIRHAEETFAERDYDWRAAK